MRYFDKEQVERLLDMGGCINAMRKALTQYSLGSAVQVLRTAMPFAPGKILGVMPAALPDSGLVGAKLITVFPGNFQKGLPSHQGVVALFSAQDGSLQTILDAEAITGIRTAAVSAAVTDALARRDAHILCMMGSGLQARKHLEAMLLVRSVDEVRVWDVNEDSALRFKAEMEAKWNVKVIDCCRNAESAVRGADIICTVTSSPEPILFGAQLSPGVHINAVGACGAANRELDAEAVRRSRLYCDSRESCMSEAGDFLIPLKSGEVQPEQLLGEVGLVFAGKLKGRQSENDITLFEAQGLAVEDLAAAGYVMERC